MPHEGKATNDSPFDALGVVLRKLCLSCDRLTTHRRNPEVHAAGDKGGWRVRRSSATGSERVDRVGRGGGETRGDCARTAL